MEALDQSEEHRSTAGNLPAYSVASARTGQCLGMWEIGGGSGKYWHCTLLLD